MNDEVVCEALFERLVTDDPERLIRFLQPGAIESALQTFAAEIAGRLPSAEPALLTLLECPEAVVREGAILGLAHHDSRAVNEALRRVAATDASPAVRGAAADVLSNRGEGRN